MKRRPLESLPPEIWIRAVFFRMAPLDEATKNRLWQQLEDAGLWTMTEDLVKDVAQEIVEQLSQHGRGASFLEIDHEFKFGRYLVNKCPMDIYNGLEESNQGTPRRRSASYDAEDIAIFQFRVQVAEQERICHRAVLNKAEIDAMWVTMHKLAKVAESFGASLRRLLPRDEPSTPPPPEKGPHPWVSADTVRQFQAEGVCLPLILPH